MGNNFVNLNKHMHPYVELFDKVYDEAIKNNPLFKLESVVKDDLPVDIIYGPGFTLVRSDEPHHRSYTYSNGIDYFFISRVLNASAIVRIGNEEIKFEDILASPKALVFLKEIAISLNTLLNQNTKSVEKSI